MQTKQDDRVKHIVGAKKVLTVLSCSATPLARDLVPEYDLCSLAPPRPGTHAPELTAPTPNHSLCKVAGVQERLGMLREPSSVLPGRILGDQESKPPYFY